MNVTAGDVAMYIGHVLELRGMVFHVLRPCGNDCWWVDPPPPRSRDYVSSGIVMDKSLRRIGNPGEHERDEMLRPLPVEDLDIAHA